MDDLNYRRLQWMAQAEIGQKFPPELFGDSNRWGPAVTEAVKAALADVEELRDSKTGKVS